MPDAMITDAVIVQAIVTLGAVIVAFISASSARAGRKDLAEIKKDSAIAAGELVHNGGSSARDELATVLDRLLGVDRRVAGLESKQDRMSAKQDRMAQDVGDLKRSAVSTERSVSGVRDEMREDRHRVNHLDERVTDIEHHELLKG